MTKSLHVAKFVHCSIIAFFALWSFVVEKDYGFDLILRHEFVGFIAFDRNLCQGGDCCFVT